MTRTWSLGTDRDSRWNCYWSRGPDPQLQKQQLLDPTVSKISQPQITVSCKLPRRPERKSIAPSLLATHRLASLFFKLGLGVTKCTDWRELIWMRVCANYWPNCKHRPQLEITDLDNPGRNPSFGPTVVSLALFAIHVRTTSDTLIVSLSQLHT